MTRARRRLTTVGASIDDSMPAPLEAALLDGERASDEGDACAS
jgi:hypothetical protein